MSTACRPTTTLPEKVSFVGSDEKQSGTLEMQEVCKLMGGKGTDPA